MELFWLVGEACAELSRIKAGMERSLLLHRVRLGTRRSYKAVVNSSCEERWIMLLSRLVHFTVVLLLLLYRGQSNAAPQVGDLNGQQEGVSAASVRLRHSGEPSTYWWLPGGGGGHPQVTYSHISCGEPGRPVSGSSLFELVHAGALVVQSCNPGFKLEGATLRLCQSNGQWTPQLPQSVDCGDPGEPVNGSWWVGSTLLHAVAKFRCDPGFRLAGGDSLRVCRGDGRWSGSLLSCQAVGCRQLAPPANGAVLIQPPPSNGASSSVGAEALYSCRPGFQLQGQERRVCGPGGVWLDQEPLCQPIFQIIQSIRFS